MRKVAVLLSAVGVGIGGVIFACGSSDPGLPDLPTNDAATFDTAQSEGGPGDSTGPLSPAEDFCKGTLGAYAGYIDKCCSVTDKALPDGITLTQHAQSLVAACISTLSASVGKGRVMYQQAQAEACKAAYATKFQDMSLCSTLQQIDPGVEADPMCAIAFVGTGDNNALCSSDVECKDGFTCVGYGGGNDGTCRMPSAAGGACGTVRNDGSLGPLVLPMGVHPACAAGNFCDPTNTMCKAQGGDLAACTRNDMCTEPKRCDGTGKCTVAADNALKPTGAACNTTVDCVVGAFCDHTDADGGPVGKCATKKTSTDICVATDTGSCSGLCISGTCNVFCMSN